MILIRGYAGFYKGYYLKSSYEYAYAKYLDFIGAKWKYEEHHYNLRGKGYTPDFFIYNQKNELLHIVEIKSNKEEYLEKARIKIKLLKEIYGIDCGSESKIRL